MTTTKYGNKPFWYNTLTGSKVDSKVSEHCVYWDSVLEFNVYCELRKLFPSTAIFRQHPILIKPASTHYARRVWSCDFQVLPNHGDYINIEVKGKWLLSDNAALSDFTKTLQFLNLHNPTDYNRLVIVSDTQWRIDKQWKTTPLPTLIRQLKSLQSPVKM